MLLVCICVHMCVYVHVCISVYVHLCVVDYNIYLSVSFHLGGWISRFKNHIEDF